MPKQVDHEARRRELTRAVRRVVGSGGLDSLTVREVAKESGWSTGVLAHYFESRADLVLAAFQDVYQSAWERSHARVGEHEDPIAGVIAALEEAVPVTESLRTDARVWFAFVGLAVGDGQLREAAREGYDRWTTYLGEVIRSAHPGEIGQPEAELVARRLTALVDGLTVQALFDPEAFPATVLRDEIRIAVEREFSLPAGRAGAAAPATVAPRRTPRPGAEPIAG